VPHSDPVWTRVNELDEVRPELLDEIAHFFEVYKDLEPNKTVTVEGWQGRLEAEKLVREARDAHAAHAARTA
jgi:inorganic pyrophosphatase